MSERCGRRLGLLGVPCGKGAGHLSPCAGSPEDGWNGAAERLAAERAALRAELEQAKRERDDSALRERIAAEMEQKAGKAYVNTLARAETAEAKLAERDAELAAFKGEVWLPLSVREGLTTPAQWAKRGQEFLKSLQDDCASARAEAAALREALDGLLANPGGCSLCDLGVPRKPAKGHQPDCPFEIAAALSSTAGRDLLEELERLREQHRWVVCTYCGEKYERESADMPARVVDHLLACEKRPEKALAAELERVRADFDEADGHIAEVQVVLMDTGFEAGADGDLLHGIGKMQEEMERLRAENERLRRNPALTVYRDDEGSRAEGYAAGIEDSAKAAADWRAVVDHPLHSGVGVAMAIEGEIRALLAAKKEGGT